MLDFDRLPKFREFRFQILKLIPEWVAAYETTEAEILRQIGWAHAWCNANPRKAPKKDPVRFLWNWMRHAKRYDNILQKRVDLTYREDKPADSEIMDGEDFRKMREALPPRSAPAKDFP